MLIPAIRAIWLLSLPRRKARNFKLKNPVTQRLKTATQSTLALLVAGVGADHVDHPAAAHDLAVLADLLDGSTNLHDSSPRWAAGPCRARSRELSGLAR